MIGDSMKKYIELIFPIMTTVVLGVIFRISLKGEIVQVNAIEFILGNIFSLVTTLMGFIITIITVFVSFVKSKIMKYLKRNNKIRMLLFYFIEPLIWGVLVIIDIGYLATKFNELNNMYINQLLVALIFISLFMLTVLRITLVLCKLLFIIVEEPESIEEKRKSVYKVN